MTNCLICDSHQILHERRTSTLTVSRCHTCGHRTATHSSDPSLRSIDYHKQYESSGFLSALEITRRRQAAMMAFQIQQFLPEPGAILDFGCGHGWFLEACAAAGLSPLMGVDTSALAISELAKKGIQGMTINIG